MHVTRPPPPEPALNRPDSPPPRLAGAVPSAGDNDRAADLAPLVAEAAIAGATAALHGDQELSMAAAPLADQVHIQPLDLKGALQILIAEVRAELPLPGDAPRMGIAPTLTPATVPQALVLEFLQALPDASTAAATHEPAAWMAAVSRVEAGVQLALDRGMATVAAWHEVPPPVVEVVHETRALVMGALLDDPPNPLWLRPEWLGLAPRMERFRRRRRYARRRISDPDRGSIRPEDSRVRDDEDWDPSTPFT